MGELEGIKNTEKSVDDSEKSILEQINFSDRYTTFPFKYEESVLNILISERTNFFDEE